MSKRKWLVLLLYFVTVFAMPLVGIAASGRRIDSFLVFPPRAYPVEPAPFSWPAFWFLSLVVSVSLAPLLWKIATTTRTAGVRVAAHPFPVFGWAGLAVLVIAWILAWTRFQWCASSQPFTFTPLWIGYITVVNALTLRRAGTCPLISETRRMIALFPLSALFWWSFEYLNQFVGNWIYPEALAQSAGRSLLEGTVAFSTVLPAVYSTAAWLTTYPSLVRGLDRFKPVRVATTPLQAFVMLALGALLLAVTAVWPTVLFPLLWVAPIPLLSGLQRLLLGGSALHRAFAAGDFRRLWAFALAALVCGFFWELWNFRSLAHWQYQIPYVGRFHVFEMPLLGYTGYLPFGLLSALFIDGAPCPARRNAKMLSVGRAKRYHDRPENTDSRSPHADFRTQGRTLPLHAEQSERGHS